MDFLYNLIKFLHIMLTILAVGFNISYGMWLSQAKKDPTKLEYTLKGIKYLDDRFANPAYLMLMVTGVIMILVAGSTMTAFWLWFSTILWVIMMLMAYLMYTPSLRRQIQTLQKTGTNSLEYRSLAARVQVIGLVLAFMVVVIILLMVYKPTF
jgi:uncharacterized membrane protein